MKEALIEQIKGAIADGLEVLVVCNSEWEAKQMAEAVRGRPFDAFRDRYGNERRVWTAASGFADFVFVPPTHSDRRPREYDNVFVGLDVEQV